MAEFNAKLASQTTKHDEILQNLGGFPYLQQNMEGPETTGTADVLVLEIGDALKLVGGKVARYQNGDSEDIYAIAASGYDSTALNAASSPAGHIDMYVFGCIIGDKVNKLNTGGDARESLSSADILKARKLNLFIM